MPMEMGKMISGYPSRYCHLNGDVVPNQSGPRLFRDPSLYCRTICTSYIELVQADCTLSKPMVSITIFRIPLNHTRKLTTSVVADYE